MSRYVCSGKRGHDSERERERELSPHGVNHEQEGCVDNSSAYVAMHSLAGYADLRVGLLICKLGMTRLPFLPQRFVMKVKGITSC